MMDIFYAVALNKCVRNIYKVDRLLYNTLKYAHRAVYTGKEG